MNLKNKLLILLFSFFIIIPINSLAYSKKVILGGNNIGISVNCKDVMVVGFYKINGVYTAKESGFSIGDKITHINNIKVNSIDDIINLMNDYINGKLVLTIKRDGVSINIDMKLYKDSNGIYKTGLYIKDKITGIGTLTYIDPTNKTFGALGHPIQEMYTNEKVDISNGIVFQSSITGNTRSTNTTTGEKNAILNQNEVYGTIKKNTLIGIYGKYNIDISNNLIEIGNIDDIALGEAYIYTVIKNDEIEKFTIDILKINDSTIDKNILFKITDKKLLNETNGVIKGMSGSPIVQNNKLIGAVTHAIVNDKEKGYGILITNMLKEGDK